MVKLYLRLGNDEKVMEKYRKVLEYIKGKRERERHETRPRCPCVRVGSLSVSASVTPAQHDSMALL